MSACLPWLAIAGPFALAFAAAYGLPDASSHALRRTLRLANAATAIALASAVATACGAFDHPIQIDGFAIAGIGLGLYLDRLSAILLVLVAFIGMVVVRYSVNYMDGDPRQRSFIRRLCLTLASVLLLIVSGNLFQFALAWIATSLSLHGLLVFYRHRPAAILAANKKFLVSRIGDICVLAAMVLLYRNLGALDYRTIMAGAEAARLSGSLPAALQAACLLLAGAALLKSAQFPAHGWLIEVMETPTPVSALLHAGIINAGGFLVLRFADLISLSAPTLDVLMVSGALTALFGSLVMLTQTSIKVSLAYSTIAQMGFMMLECGLGAYSAALLHLVAHSLYKAHAFLSAGSAMNASRGSMVPLAQDNTYPARIVIAIALVIGVTLGIGAWFGATAVSQPGNLALVAILLLGLIHLMANSIDERPSVAVIVRVLVIAVAVAIGYFVLQAAAEHGLRGSLPVSHGSRTTFDVFLMACIVIAFAALTLFQNLVRTQSASPTWRALHVHAANGFYVNTLANRWILRFWPASNTATRRQPTPGAPA